MGCNRYRLKITFQVLLGYEVIDVLHYILKMYGWIFFSFQGKGKILIFGGHVGTTYIDREYK